MRDRGLTAVICGAPKASGNGYGAYTGDGTGDRADPRASFSFGGCLAAYGAGNGPLRERARIDRHDSLRDETRGGGDHGGEVFGRWLPCGVRGWEWAFEGTCSD